MKFRCCTDPIWDLTGKYRVGNYLNFPLPWILASGTVIRCLCVKLPAGLTLFLFSSLPTITERYHIGWNLPYFNALSVPQCMHQPKQQQLRTEKQRYLRRNDNDMIHYCVLHSSPVPLQIHTQLSEPSTSMPLEPAAFTVGLFASDSSCAAPHPKK